MQSAEGQGMGNWQLWNEQAGWDAEHFSEDVRNTGHDFQEKLIQQISLELLPDLTLLMVLKDRKKKKKER